MMDRNDEVGCMNAGVSFGHHQSTHKDPIAIATRHSEPTRINKSHIAPTTQSIESTTHAKFNKKNSYYNNIVNGLIEFICLT